MQLIKTLSTIAITIALCGLLTGQSVEITGSARITSMNRITTPSENVVRQADGTLGFRKYEIGDFAQGGVVFYVDETGEHGLVCAKDDQSTGIRWYAGSAFVVNAKGDGPFAGEMNTAVLIAGHTGTADDGNTYAGRLCAELMITEGAYTYGDWYLPSKHELSLMQQNREVIEATALANDGSAFGAFFQYWSSTEDSNSNAWSQNITIGGQFSTSKSSGLRVRAIRAF